MTVEESKRYLVQAARSGAPAGTWLVTGADADTRREMGVLFARALFCPVPGAEPCGRCAACRQTAAHNHPDLFLVRGEGDKGLQAGLLKIDQVRRLKAEINLSPYQADYRVYVIDAETMRDETANAFLKTLEEPPDTAILFLLGQTEWKLPPTILSRAVRIRLTEPAPAVTVFKEISALLDLSWSRPAEIFRLAQKTAAAPEGKLKEFLRNLAVALTLVLKAKAGAPPGPGKPPAWLDRLADRFDSPAEVQRLLEDYLDKRLEILRGLASPRLALETVFIALAAPRRKPPEKTAPAAGKR